MTSAEADALRRGIINQSHFGTRQPVPEEGWKVATSPSVAVLTGEKRDRLFDRVFHCGTFDDDDHTSGSLDFEGRTAKFQLQADSKTLLVTVE
jgi:hypothetical protein